MGLPDIGPVNHFEGVARLVFVVQIVVVRAIHERLIFVKSLLLIIQVLAELIDRFFEFRSSHLKNVIRMKRNHVQKHYCHGQEQVPRQSMLVEHRCNLCQSLP